MTTLERIAGWASDVQIGDAPDEVVELCRAQRRSVLAAVAASVGDRSARRVLTGVETWAAEGPAHIPGLDGGLRVDDAIYAAAALTIALDFDDYLCFAHSGHSAVLVPMLLAAETQASGTEQLGAQLVVNEVAARLGAACLIGPLNGQLWSFVHAAGASLAAGRLLRLGAGRLAHALALALYQAPRPTVPGFMAPDSKLLTAAEPTLVGLRAARLAAVGVTGPLDLLDHPQGFLDAFSYSPLPALLEGLGEGWATHTLSIKRYPGCAYLDTAVDALLSLGPIAAEQVESVRVDASVLSCEMDALSRPFTKEGSPSPVTVTFSVPWSLSTAVLAGRLTPAETNHEWLSANHQALSDLAGRVSLVHDWGLTLRSAAAMAPLLPPRALAAGVDKARLAAGLRRIRRDHGPLGLGPAGAMALGRALWSAGLEPARRALAARRPWDPQVLGGFTMAFPARVVLRLRSGQELTGEAEVPLGGAGSRIVTPEVASRQKLAEQAPSVWGDDGAEEIAKAIETDSDGLWKLLGATR